MVYDKAVIIVEVHFSMQNTKLSHDLGCALRWDYVSIHLYHP